MRKSHFLKKIGMGILGITLCLSLFGISAKALDPIRVYGGVDTYTNFASAEMINCTGHNAYCEVFLRQGNNSVPTNTISTNSGIMNCEDPLKTTGYRTMNHAFSTGIVYYGNHPNSGVEVTATALIGN